MQRAAAPRKGCEGWQVVGEVGIIKNCTIQRSGEGVVGAVLAVGDADGLQKDRDESEGDAAWGSWSKEPHLLIAAFCIA